MKDNPSPEITGEDIEALARHAGAPLPKDFTKELFAKIDEIERQAPQKEKTKEREARELGED